MIRIELKIWFLIPFSGDDFAILFNTESLNHVHGENDDDTSGRIEILKLITTEQKRISRIRARIEKRNRQGVHTQIDACHLIGCRRRGDNLIDSGRC